MPFQKGVSGNRGGRGLGTPNKVTQMQREFIQKILDNQTGRFEKELSRLKGIDYVKAILGLIEFTVPKLSRAEIKNITPPSEKVYFKLPGGQLVEI